MERSGAWETWGRGWPFILPALLVALPLAVYLKTLAPSITWAHMGADSGDLATAVAVLGIPHPTGYPLYVLLGRAWSYLVPWGDVAHRLNLLSAVCATGVVVLSWLLGREAAREAGVGDTALASAAAGVTALALAFSPLLWSQAVIAEVYALHTLLAVALAWALLRYWRRGGARWLAVAGLLLGLGLANHLTLALAVPTVALVALLRGGRRAWPLLPPVAVGLALYAYLPLRSAQGPPLNWGEPHTLAGFLWVVGGEPYRDFVLGLPLRYLPQRLLAWLGLLLNQGTALGLFLALVGAWRLGQRRPALLSAGALYGALVSAYAITYNTTDSRLYLLPLLPLGASLAGAGLAWLAGALLPPRSAWALVGATLALPLLLLAANYRSVDLSRDTSALDYARDVVASVGEDALVVADTDAHMFALWYAKYTHQGGGGPLVVASPLLRYDWYWGQVVAQAPSTGGSPEGLEARLKALVDAFGPCRTYFATRTASLGLYPLEPWGRLFRPRCAGG